MMLGLLKRVRSLFWRRWRAQRGSMLRAGIKKVDMSSSKFQTVSKIVAGYARERKLSMLDVGCRGCELKPYIEEFGSYVCADLFQNASGTVDFVGDFAVGLPVADEAYDISFALDVIEHTDDMLASLDELMRVSRLAALVILPNFAHIRHRWAYLLRGHFGTEKYDVVYPPRPDRHRWLTTTYQTDGFMAGYAKARGYDLKIEHLAGSRWAWVERVLTAVGGSRGMWVDNAFYVLIRRSS